MLTTMVQQRTPERNINDLNIDEILTLMSEQYDPAKYVVQKRYKFWSDMTRKKDKYFVASLRQEAILCDFQSIKHHLNETMRTKFMRLVQNEAEIKPLFRLNKADLTFEKAVPIAQEIVNKQVR